MDRMTRNNAPMHSQRRNMRNSCDHSEILKKISQIDFALYDLNLYLDAYPNCPDALSMYHQLRNARVGLVAEYEKLHGPLTASADGSESWNWVKTPWPWE